MSSHDPRTTTSPVPRIGAYAVIAIAAIAIVIGLMLGINLARALTPAPDEARQVMQLLGVERSLLATDAKAGRCGAIATERLRALVALTDLAPLALRDRVVVDDRFIELNNRLRTAVETLPKSALGEGCSARVKVLEAMDAACEACHDEYRSGA